MVLVIPILKMMETEPGSIIEFDIDFWGNVYASGAHNFSIFELIRIGYSIFPEEMPKEIKIFGIEVEDVETFSRQCSPSVEAAIPKAISKIKDKNKLISLF